MRVNRKTRKRIVLICDTISLLVIGIILGMALGYQLCCLKYNIPIEIEIIK